MQPKPSDSLARTGSICFDLDGNLIEDCSRNKTKKRHKMKDDFEGRWKKEEEEISRLSHSLSSSVLVDISDSGTAEEMNQKHYKLWGQTQVECSCCLAEYE